MGKFSPGFLFGVGLGVLLAPMPGRDMRQLIAERMQKLRKQLPENMPSVHLPVQTSDITSQASSVLKSVSGSVQRTVSQYTDQTQQADKDDATTFVPSPLAVSPSQVAEPVETSSSDVLLSEIPGMEPEVQKALEDQGIGTSQQLLDHAPTRQERANLAHEVGVNVHRLKTLTDRADLMRLQGVDADIATMLEEAGVNGCKDLQHRNPEHLHAVLTELYEKKQIALPPPEVEQLMQWIAEAKGVAVTAKE